MARLPRLLVTLFFFLTASSVFALSPAGFDDLLPGFSISIPETEDGLLEIALPAGSALPQLPDSLTFTLNETNELLTQELIGTGLAKIVVRRGVKTVKKLFKKAQAARAKRIALRNFPPKGGCSTVRVVSYNVGVFHKSGFDKTFIPNPERHFGTGRKDRTFYRSGHR